MGQRLVSPGPARSAKYWVLFLQPLPEAGERIAVALVFRDIEGGARVEFDGRFSRVLKLYPDLDCSALRFYLESMQRDLNESQDLEATLNSYGPQIWASSARQVAAPISVQLTKMLLARYLYPADAKPDTIVSEAQEVRA